MVTLHKLNGTPIVINAELIESLEAGPETVVNLATGNRFLVRESADEITALVVAYRRRLHAEGGPVNPIKGFKREGGDRA